MRFDLSCLIFCRLAEEDFHTDKGKECAANRIDNISDETLIMESGQCTGHDLDLDLESR